MSTKTFAVTACLPVIYTGGSGVNPGDLHIPLGEWAPGAGTGWHTRALLKAPVSFSGMTAITEARLYVYGHTGGSWHAKGSGTVSVDTRRKTSDWSESSGGSSTATDEVWGGSSGSLVSAGYVDDSDGNGGINNGAADRTVDYIPITYAVRAWFGGAPNYGLMVFAVGSSSSDACELYSRRSAGEVPYIWIDYETNTAPNAPTGLNPAAETVHSGRTITYSATRSDPDSGDYITAYDIAVYLTDRTTLVQSYNSGVLSGSPTSFTKALTLPSGHNANREYSWRARTRDRSSAWGPWSGWATFRANTPPSTPPAPVVETDTLTPVISGSASDPDSGDSINGIAVEVWNSALSSELWHPSTFSEDGSYSIPYAGPALAWGGTYKARVRGRDTFGAFSAYSAWRTFTLVQPVGPNNLTPRSTAAKLNTLTPVLTVGHTAYTFRNHEAEVWTAATGGVRLWLSPVVADYPLVNTKALTYAGTALAWGGTYYWRARVEDSSGVISAWSPRVPFYVNAEPLAPSPLVARTSAGSAVVLTDGVYLVTTAAPILEAEYQDPDLETYGDLPTERAVEVYARAADGSAGALVHSNTLPAPPYTSPMAYTLPAATLVLGSSYLVRWRFKDNAGRVSPWSAYMTVRYTAGPTLGLTAPAEASLVTDQTPLLDWTYSSSAGKVQATRRVRIYDLGPSEAPTEEVEVHDTGVLGGPDTAYPVPAGVLVNGRTYRWTVTVTDSDGLEASL